jgi:hypothetical protein
VPSGFHPGDAVRLDDGRIAVVTMVLDDYSPDPSKDELLLHHRPRGGEPDDDLFPPSMARPAPDPKSREEARAEGLLEGLNQIDPK